MSQFFSSYDLGFNRNSNSILLVWKCFSTSVNIKKTHERKIKLLSSLFFMQMFHVGLHIASQTSVETNFINSSYELTYV